MERVNQLSILFSSSNLNEYKTEISIFLISIVLAHVFMHRWNQRNVKGPKSWPFIGVLIELLMNYHRMHDWLTDYFVESKTVEVPLPFKTLTFIADPENVEHVLKTNFHNYPKGEGFHMRMEELLGDGIFNSDGEMWKQQRKTASLEFASRNLRNFSTTVFRDYALILSGILHQASGCNKEVDMQGFINFMEYFNSLPVEITSDVLSRVPAESVLECKLVCTSWRNLVRNQSFSKMHLHHLNHPSIAAHDSGKLSYIALINFRRCYYFGYNENHESAAPIERITRLNLPPPLDTVTFVGSCNGLICLVKPLYLQVGTYICNPITREYVRLPEIEKHILVTPNLGYYWTSGFGYVSSTNEYKVVAIVSVEKEFVEVFIYTLGSGSGWRNLGKFDSPFRAFDWEQAGIFASGALYWLDTGLRMIVTFDLVEEMFCTNHSPPPLPQNSNWRYHTLGVLNGFLFFSSYLVVKDAECFDIWLLKKKNESHNKKESLVWIKEFSVCGRGNLLAVTKSGGGLTYIDTLQEKPPIYYVSFTTVSV